MACGRRLRPKRELVSNRPATRPERPRFDPLHPILPSAHGILAKASGSQMHLQSPGLADKWCSSQSSRPVPRAIAGTGAHIMAHNIPTWKRETTAHEDEYTMMLFQSETMSPVQKTAVYPLGANSHFRASTSSYTAGRPSGLQSYPASVHPVSAACMTTAAPLDSIGQALSDDEMLDEIFQEIMSPGPQGPKDFVLTSSSALLTPPSTSSAPSTPQLTLRTGCAPPMMLGSISPNMATAMRAPSFPVTVGAGAGRNLPFFPFLPECKTRSSGGFHSSLSFASPTSAGRRGYRRANRPTRVQKKKPTSRICRMVGCTKGIRSRGLCKAHGGGRRCTTPGCEISDQGGGHCIAHGGGRRCSVSGCKKSAQSKGLCKLHGGARLCRLPDCNKNGQIKGLCRLHYSLSMAAKASAATATPPATVKMEPRTTLGPGAYGMRV